MTGPMMLDALALKALAHIPNAVAILGADHRYRWANQAFLTLTGIDLARLCALPYVAVTASDDADDELQALAQLHEGGSEQVSWSRGFSYDGRKTHSIEVTAHAIRNAQGVLEAMVWILSRTAEETATMADGLHHSLREARDDLRRVAALLSHDAVQSTRMIASYAGLIGHHLESELGERERKYLESIRQSGAELKDLLGEVANFLRVPERMAPAAPFSLRQCSMLAAERLASRMPDLVVQVGSELDIALDPQDLELCLRAAISLAWARSASGLVEISGSIQNGIREVVVAAPGAILDEGDDPRVFMLGARISLGARSGTLLPGMAVARRISQRVGGDVTVDGEGGAVRVVLRFGN